MFYLVQRNIENPVLYYIIVMFGLLHIASITNKTPMMLVQIFQRPLSCYAVVFVFLNFFSGSRTKKATMSS